MLVCGIPWMPVELRPSDRQSAHLNEYHGSRDTTTYGLQTGKVLTSMSIMVPVTQRLTASDWQSTYLNEYHGSRDTMTYGLQTGKVLTSMSIMVSVTQRLMAFRPAKCLPQ